ncbi:MAG: Fis family transcriptional [Planctomycetota bacterium]|nr:MAG: Fis family transcriptional [Planctomycetota bacterium]
MTPEHESARDRLRRLQECSLTFDPGLRSRTCEEVISRIVMVTRSQSATFVHRPVMIFRLAPRTFLHPKAPHGEVVSGERIQAAFRFGRSLRSPDLGEPPPDATGEMRAVLAGTTGIWIIPFAWLEKTVAILALAGAPTIRKLSKRRLIVLESLLHVLRQCVQEALPPALAATTEIRDGRIVTVFHKAVFPPVHPVADASGPVDPCPEILGRSAARRALVEQIQKVAPTDAIAVITGETGTGKELVARAIHANSSRRKEPFVAIDLSKFNANLIENELFGHEAGGYSGAGSAHAGSFEAAGKGTILLDEIGEVPLDLQAKLLSVLENRDLCRVGGTKTVPIPARIVVATRRDLGAMRAAGRFREDLLYRIMQFPIHALPLRDRREDIPTLIAYFLLRLAKLAGLPTGFTPAIEPQAEAHLTSLRWPGNVRELFAFLRFAVLSCMPGAISLNALRVLVPRWEKETGTGDGDPRQAEERIVFLEAFRKSDGTTTGIAEILDITRQAALERFKKHGLTPLPGRRRRPRPGNQDGGR